MTIREAYIRSHHGLAAGNGTAPAGLLLSLLLLLP